MKIIAKKSVLQLLYLHFQQEDLMIKSKRITILIFTILSIFLGSLFLHHKASNNKFYKNDQNYEVKSRDLNKNPKSSMEIAAIKLFYEGSSLDTSTPIYIERNRFYLPLIETINKICNTTITEAEIIPIKFNNKSIKINIKKNTFKLNNNTYKFMQKLIYFDDTYFISLFDLTNIFDMKPSFNYTKNTISLYRNKDILPVFKQNKSNKAALLRLEDITAGKTYRYHTDEAKYKLRIIADYLYSEGIPFHAAWVPRYIDNEMGNHVDNDLANINSMNNADFLYTLDYFISKGGIIGLHGYTHQAGNERSIDSIEFGNSKDKESFTNDYALKRINKAKEAAKKLNIPIDFFETPHYARATNQLKVIENNFNYIYEPYISSGVNESTNIVVKKDGKRVIKYIPTPLNYLDGKRDLPNMFKKINNLKSGVMASFFFHPNIEFDDIKVIKEANGYTSYTYSQHSALHQIISVLKSKGYSFIIINNL